MYLSKRFYIFCVAAVVLFLAGYVFPVLFMAGKMLLVAQALLSAADIALLWRQKDGVYAERSCAARFSNGDPNPVRIAVENRYPTCFSGAIFFSRSTCYPALAKRLSISYGQ